MMGFFNKPDTVPTSQTLPLSNERIAAFLTSQEWHFQEDSDGDIGGIWDDNLFYFFRLGEQKEILQVRGRWKHQLPLTSRQEFLDFADTYHRDRIWPKSYSREEDDKLSIYVESSTDLEHGVSDDQLGQLIRCGLFTGLRFFDALSDRFGLTEQD